MEIKQFENPEESAKGASRELSQLIFNANSDSVLLLVSGGSAFGILAEIDEKVLNSNLTVGMLDERFSLDSAINNFAQLKETEFYIKASNSNVHFISSEVTNGEGFEYFTKRFEESIKEWAKQNPNGKIIATLGMGPDGHTAGIMPFPENGTEFTKLFEGDSWVVGYDATGKTPYTQRVTVTNTFLKEKVDSAVAYVVGKEKKEALEKLDSNGSFAKAPVRIWKLVKNLKIFTNIQ